MTRSQALVLAGHGSQRHPGAAAPLHAHGDRIRSRGLFDEVRVACWKEEPPLHDVRVIVASDEAYVVPVLTSEGYFADTVFPREVGADSSATPPATPRIRYTQPVGTHDAMGEVIEDRIEAALDGPPDDVGVALVGHGTERNGRSARATNRHAMELRDRGRYGSVVALFLDEAPYVGDVFDHLDAEELVVVPLFVADGYHTTRDIPRAIGHPGIGETATVDGRVVHYTGAVGTEPRLADVIVERAIEAGARPDGPSGGSRTDGSKSTSGENPRKAVDAFIRWLRSSVEPRRWGDLSILRGKRGFELRHQVDADETSDDLDALADGTALREHVRFDDLDRYRPLSGARSLPTGWVLAGLDGDGVVGAIRFVYPGSIAHWYQSRSGDLDSTDFDETVARQTGLYADLDGLDGPERAAATEAVCGDCVRRRCWNTGTGDVTGAPVSHDEIPCPEACPFFLSAAYAFLEHGVDADARAGPTVPAGALEDPGNEYRIRYARAHDRHAGGQTDTPSAGGGP